jgi:hypothetical protein
MLNEQSNKAEDARHFVDFPVELAFFDEFADHLEELEGAEITEFSVDGIVDMTLEFEYRNNSFLVDIYFDDYRFFVEDAKCPEEILLEIIEHFRKLLPE